MIRHDGWRCPKCDTRVDGDLIITTTPDGSRTVRDIWPGEPCPRCGAPLQPVHQINPEEEVLPS